MRIDHLHLQNFKGFASAKFKFHPRFNLIVGENGSGKTSLLDGLAVAAASWFLGIRGYDGRNIESDDIRRVASTQGDTTKIEAQFPVVVRAQGLVTNATIDWQRAVDSIDGRTTRTDAKDIQRRAQAAELSVRDGNPFVLPLISSYGAGRLWVPARDMRGAIDPTQSKPEGDSRFAGYLFSIDPRINFAELFRWLAHERYVSLERGSDRFGFAAVKTAMKECLERCVSLDYSVAEKTVVVEMDGRGQLPFHLLSDGQKVMLALAADIALKAAQLNPHLEDRVLQETPGVVMIDELDLHLHPRWQRHVVADLKKTFPSIQFFATTHSPQVIGETPHDEIILLHQDGSWTQPHQSVGLSINQVFREIMQVLEINLAMKQKFEALFRAVESGDFTSARAQIVEIRRSGEDFPELVEATGYMAAVEEAKS